MIVRSKAPLRISFCGGGTDVSPYLEERGGVVLSATIDKFAYGVMRTLPDRSLSVHSLDYDFVAKYSLEDDLPNDHKLDLIRAVVRRLELDRGPGGLSFFIHSDAPPGSGLGSSSAMVVALIGLARQGRRLPLTHYEIAKLACQIERTDLGIPGGLQDQYSATFGSFNFIEFSADSVLVNPLRVHPDIVNELEYNLLLCYTGMTRSSGNIITEQVAGYVRREEDVVLALDRMKEITVSLKGRLLQGRLDEFGELLGVAWEMKKKLTPAITNDRIDDLYEIARQTGCVGGKLLGAGGGGYLLLYCEFGTKHVVAEALERAGGQIVPFSFEHQGLQTWLVPDAGPAGDRT